MRNYMWRSGRGSDSGPFDQAVLTTVSLSVSVKSSHSRPKRDSTVNAPFKKHFGFSFSGQLTVLSEILAARVFGSSKIPEKKIIRKILDLVANARRSLDIL